MPERPLLLFPTPQPADRTKQKPQFGRVHKPNVTRQGQRLSPMFNQIVELLNTESGEFLNTALLCKNLATEYKGKS